LCEMMPDSLEPTGGFASFLQFVSSFSTTVTCDSLHRIYIAGLNKRAQGVLVQNHPKRLSPHSDAQDISAWEEVQSEKQRTRRHWQPAWWTVKTWALLGLRALPPQVLLLFFIPILMIHV
jgi:hypothetical protein